MGRSLGLCVATCLIAGMTVVDGKRMDAGGAQLPIGGPVTVDVLHAFADQPA